MRRHWLFLAASTCALCYSVAAAAQQAAPAGVGVSEDDAGAVAEIVVTARRKSENLQNVPQTVDVVSAETINKLKLTQFQDIAAITPGLTLATAPAGSAPVPTLRGVTFDASASPSPTVDVYVNEAPSSVYDAFRAMYDVADVQVLRGPQGTLRGRTAPSGAILLNLHRASTTSIDSYASALVTDKGSFNAQAAIGGPIIEDVLGLRVAGLVDRNDGNFVESAAGGRKPDKNTYSGRASLTFTPTSNFRADVMAQYLDVESHQYIQVAGDGAPGGVTPLAPAGYNGPVIKASDRLSPDDAPNYNHSKGTLITTNLSWDVLGQQLQYIFSYAHNDNLDLTSVDNGNSLIGFAPMSSLRSLNNSRSHELRLSSVGSGHLIDYSVGYFHAGSDGSSTGDGPAAALSGAFGAPDNPDPSIYNADFVLPSHVRSESQAVEDSIYGSGTLHLGERTELTLGGRYIIRTKSRINLNVLLGAGNIAMQFPFPCAFAGFGSTYAGYCDVPLAASTTPIISSTSDRESHPFVYNASLSHRVTDDLTVYGTVGSSWRRGGFNISITDVSGDPDLQNLLFAPDEKSTSYELGAKGSLMDRRLRYSVSAYHQEFKNLAFQVTSIPYVTSNGQSESVANTFINIGADAKVDGIDFSSSFQASRALSIGLSATYAKGKVDNDLIPCRDSNFDGVADSGSPTLAQFQAAGKRIAYCKSDQSVSRVPRFNATLNAEYSFPLSGASDAYVRGFATYYAENKYADIGNTVPDYVLANLYAGVRSNEGRWDAGVFVRNVFDTGVQLTRDPAFITSAINADAAFGSAGYRVVSYTPPREIGVSVRYAFGN